VAAGFQLGFLVASLLLAIPCNSFRHRVVLSRDMLKSSSTFPEEASGSEPMKGIVAKHEASFLHSLTRAPVAISGETCSKEYRWPHDAADSGSFDCEWTRDYTCEGQQPSPNSKGAATADESLGFLCCCEGGLWSLDDPRWVPIDSTRSCEQNEEGIPRMAESDYLPEEHRSLGDCKRKCDSTPFCHAIDYYEETGWCNLYEVACSKPLKTDQGASSFRKSEYIMRSDGSSTPEIQLNVKGKACEENTQHITRIFDLDLSYGGFEACKVRCLESSSCSAFDYFEVTGHCNIYEVPCSEPLLEKDGASSYKRLPESDHSSSWISGASSFMSAKHSCVVGLLGTMNICLEASVGVDQIPFQTICRGVQASDAVGATGPAVKMTTGVQSTQCSEGPQGGQGYDCSADDLQACFATALQANDLQKALISTIHLYIAKVGPVCTTAINPCKALGLM